MRQGPSPATRSATAPAIPAGLDRWEVLDRVTAVTHRLGLNDRDVAVLRAHLTALRKGPVGPDTFPVSFMQVEALRARAGNMDARAFHRAEVRLEAAGLVRRRLSPNGKRFPVRCPETDRIIEAFGIDLSPLFAGLGRLAGLAEEAALQARRLRNRLTAISASLSRLKAACGAVPGWAEDRVQDLVRLYDRLRKRKAPRDADLDALEERIAEAIETLSEDAADDAAPAHRGRDEVPAEAAGETAVKAPCPADRNTPRSSVILPDKSSGAAGQDVLPTDPEPIENHERVHALDAARLRALWARLPALAEWYPDPPRSAGDVAGLLFEFSGYLGLGQDAVKRMVGEMGPEGALYCLDSITARITTIKAPGAYLASMLNAWRAGRPVADGRVARGRAAA